MAPKISVIIPTYNEEENIAQTLSHLRLTSERKETEIIVVDGQSADRTVDIAKALADQVLSAGHPGRSHQMHAGALAASGDLLLFLHADTRVPDNWQKELQEVWSLNEKPIATAFRLGFDNQKFFYRFITHTANWRAFWTRIPHGDQAIAIKRETYFQVGGFPPVPILEEYELFEKLKKLGPVRILPGKVVTSVRRYEKNGRLFNTLRNSLIIALYHAGLPIRFLARLYQ